MLIQVVPPRLLSLDIATFNSCQLKVYYVMMFVEGGKKYGFFMC